MSSEKCKKIFVRDCILRDSVISYIKSAPELENQGGVSNHISRGDKISFVFPFCMLSGMNQRMHRISHRKNSVGSKLT